MSEGDRKCCFGCVGLLVAIFVIAGIIGSCSSHQETSVAGIYKGMTPDPAWYRTPEPTSRPIHQRPTPKPKPTPKPLPTVTATPEPPPPTPESYEHQRRREKYEFLQSVDESVSGARIAGSPYKFVGQNVDLHCTVTSIPDQSFFNADCGEDDDGLPTNIVIQYEDTGSLEKGQSVRVLGTVTDPMEGTNAMGGSMNFPAVKAEFIE